MKIENYLGKGKEHFGKRRKCSIKPGTFGYRVNPFTNKPLFLWCLQYKSFENIVGKGEVVLHKQFLLFPQCFATLLENYLPFSSNFKLSSANSFRLEESKIWYIVWERVNSEPLLNCLNPRDLKMKT